ncbi:MAG: hypothetical protein JO037_22030 [Actinobacteria bacterium]|nr:hypothetical protein [Actinomycetota bacterium]
MDRDFLGEYPEPEKSDRPSEQNDLDQFSEAAKEYEGMLNGADNNVDSWEPLDPPEEGEDEYAAERVELVALLMKLADADDRVFKRMSRQRLDERSRHCMPRSGH